MPTAKITKRVVDAAEILPAEYVIWDTELKGFGVRVRPSGAKVYAVSYRPLGAGRTATKKRITLGATNVLSVEEARKLANEALSDIRKGTDPMLDRKAERDAITVEGLLLDYLDLHARPKRKAKTVDGYEAQARRLIIPKLGKMKAADLTRAKVASFHLDMVATPFQANRALALLSAAYQWGQKHGRVPENYNPARGVDKHAEPRRERFLTLEELQRLGASLKKAELRFGPHAVAAVRMLLFTGARLGEILKAKWSEVDIGRRVLFRADSKTGAKTIQLPAAALSILSDLPREADNPFIFPGKTTRKAGEKEKKDAAPRFDLKRVWAFVTEDACLDGLRVHDTRHSFASVAAAQNLSLATIGALLGHTQAQTTQRYSHLGNDPLRRAVEDIGAHIDDALNGGANGNAPGRDGGADIISLNKSRSH